LRPYAQLAIIRLGSTQAVGQRQKGGKNDTTGKA